MEHLVIPLTGDHQASVGALTELAAGRAALPQLDGRPRPHVTILAYSGLLRAHALTVVQRVVASVAPFTMHAHGYGLFVGDDPGELSLHVPVVRTAALERLHADLSTAIAQAGACVAGWTWPGEWSPHITLLDRGLDPDLLAAAVRRLAQHHHPSWRIRVDHIQLTGGRADRTEGDVLALGGRRGRLADLRSAVR
jgi:2'-5' RNA ligase